MEKNTGIVLKKCAQRSKIIFILDYKIGKIKCVTTKDNIITGSVISYYAKESKSIQLIDSIELLYVPFETAIDDILFLHHILEICDLFLPIQSQAKEVFELIIYLYKSEKETNNSQENNSQENNSQIKSRTRKKLFIFKLLTLLGVYPEEVKFQTPYFYNLATESIDNIIVKTLNLKEEQELNNWLHCCITIQQEFSKFKTVNFLYQPTQPQDKPEQAKTSHVKTSQVKPAQIELNASESNKENVTCIKKKVSSS